VPHVTQRTNDWGTTLALVASGLGVSIVSSTLARVHFPGVQFVNLKEGSNVGSFWVTCRDEAPEPIVQLLVSELLTETQR
jgi:DNA-binding transcriptional LysR family regulator